VDSERRGIEEPRPVDTDVRGSASSRHVGPLITDRVRGTPRDPRFTSLPRAQRDDFRRTRSTNPGCALIYYRGRLARNPGYRGRYSANRATPNSRHAVRSARWSFGLQPAGLIRARSRRATPCCWSRPEIVRNPDHGKCRHTSVGAISDRRSDAGAAALVTETC